MNTLMSFVYVGVGSMVGGICRFGFTLAFRNITVFNFAYGTLMSNILGCLLIGLIAGLSVRPETMSLEMRLLLATGFCGGFTTMSSFVLELGQLIQQKEYLYASGYFSLTLLGAGLAFLAGLLLSQLLFR